MPLPLTASTLDTFGGAKVDSGPVIDPETSISANDWNSVISDVSQMSRMTFRGEVTFDGYTGTNPVPVVSHEAMWGSSVTVLPTISYAVDGYSQGVYTVTLPATVDDPLGDEKAVPLSGTFFVNHQQLAFNAALEDLQICVSRLSPNTFKVIVRGTHTNYRFTVGYR